MSPVDPLAALRLSLLVAAAAALAGLPLAVLFGWLLARFRFPGRSLVSLVLLAPLVLPPVVTGFLLLRAFGRQAPLGGFLAAVGLPIPFTLLGAILAALVVGLPLYVLVARAAFESIDPRLEEVSLTLGVPRRATFFRVTLPLALPGLAAGAVLAFARALGEFGATIILAGNIEGETRTLALAVYTLLDLPGGESSLLLLVGLSLAVSFGALIGYEALLRGQRRRLDLEERR